MLPLESSSLAGKRSLKPTLRRSRTLSTTTCPTSQRRTNEISHYWYKTHRNLPANQSTWSFKSRIPIFPQSEKATNSTLLATIPLRSRSLNSFRTIQILTMTTSLSVSSMPKPNKAAPSSSKMNRLESGALPPIQPINSTTR